MSKIHAWPEVLYSGHMSADPNRRFEDRSASQQRFLSLFLRSEREIFRYVAALVPNVADAEDIVQQTALALWEKFDSYDPTHRLPEALRELLKAEELYSQDSDLHNAMGLVYMAIERNDLAVRHFKKAIQLKPKDSNAKNNLGVVYMNMKQWDKAIPYFEEVSKDLVYSTPHYPLLNLGWVYYNKNNYDLSGQYYLKALKLRPNYDDALYGLGRTYLAMGKIPEAINRIEAAIRISSNKPRYHYDLASAYVKSGEFKKASSAYKRVIELVPNTPLAFDSLKKIERIKVDM